MTNSAGTAANGGSSVPITERRFLAPFIPVTSLFFLWAFGVNLNDILIPHPKKGFRPERLSVFIHSGSFFWRIFPGGLSRGPAVGEDRIQERNPRGAVLVR